MIKLESILKSIPVAHLVILFDFYINIKYPETRKMDILEFIEFKETIIDVVDLDGFVCILDFYNKLQYS